MSRIKIDSHNSHNNYLLMIECTALSLSLNRYEYGDTIPIDSGPVNDVGGMTIFQIYSTAIHWAIRNIFIRSCCSESHVCEA